MKELSIEEKAKRYDKAFIKSREFLTLCEKCGAKDTVEFIEDIFPELKMDKESEDERIRGAIIDHLKDSNLTEWAAWLEKQGNTNIFDVPKISIKNAVEVTSRMQYIDDDIKPIAEFIMDYANWDLHKDEWNQPTLTVPLFRVLDALIQKGKPYCACNQNIEKQCEQKPADKIEPKFKVGDWVIDKQGIVHQVANVVENVTNHTYGYDIVGGGYFNDTVEGVRLWNISDANDGDILHSTGFHNDCIFIFNGLDNWKFDEPNGDRAVATGYCCLSVSADNMEFGMQGPDCVEVNTVKPATKIQRDLLFRKIKEAGYKWDAEKKELKKIEHKPTWSDEDESNFQGIIDVIKENKHHATDYEHMTYYKLLSWFKSLKERYVWKPSEEQIDALEHFVSCISKSGFASPYDNMRLLYSLLEQLKKL